MGLDRLERGIDRAVAVRFAVHFAPIHGKHHAGMWSLAGLAVLRQGYITILLGNMADALVTDQGQNVLIKYFAFAIREFLEAGKGSVRVCLALQRHPELDQTLLEGIASAQLAQHNLVG